MGINNRLCRFGQGIGGAALLVALTGCSTLWMPPAHQPLKGRQSLDRQTDRPFIRGRGKGAFMEMGSPVDPPLAFLQMCQRSPRDCNSGAGGDNASISATAKVRIANLLRQAFAQTHQVPARFAPGWLVSNQRGAKHDEKTLLVSGAESPTARASSKVSGSGRLDDGFYRLHYDLATQTTVGLVNRKVNRSTRRMPDWELYHVNDYWTAAGEGADARGDCEDLALEKRRELIDAGISAKALSIALAQTPEGEDHAVLIVATDSGDIVLDNLTDKISPWDATQYRWLARQEAASPLDWVAINEGRGGH